MRDRTDYEILAALLKNGRLSNKELAAKVRLAPSSCLERVRRLWESGVLKGFHAELDRRALGTHLEAMISVRLERHSRGAVESFRAHVLSLPETVRVYHTAGANDFLIHVALRDADHLRELALSAFTERPEVAHMETALLFEQADTYALPPWREGE
ncbi:MAG TPA: Lrp/AsnC family transcriptional regulator [Thermoanaerobaculia bacterium]|nr:Lrp/AsnC family transcriptional regulator [Thermoanaerobaculia bacterium]